MSFTWWEACVIAVCCSLTAIGTSMADERRAAADNPAIKAFVAYLGKNGVKLDFDGKSEWVVTDPKGNGYIVIVSLRAFPPGTSEKEMLATLKPISLAHMVNVPGALAMSVPGLRGTDPGKPLPKLDQVPVVAKLQKLFKDYQPPEAKK